MSLPNDVGFSMQLFPHGWSEAILWIDNKRFDFSLTHCFNDPIESVISATLKLARGEPNAQFAWSDEPGTWIFDFTTPNTAQHLVNVVISEFSAELPLHNQNNHISTTEFLVARDFWIHLTTTELRKISKSFQFQHYRKSRGDQFSGKLFAELEQQIKRNAG